MFSLPLLPLGDYLVFAWEGLEVKIMHFYVLTALMHMAKFTPCSYNYKQRIGSKPPTAFIADQFILSLETVYYINE